MTNLNSPRANPGLGRPQNLHRARSCHATRTATTTVLLKAPSTTPSTTALHSPRPLTHTRVCPTA